MYVCIYRGLSCIHMIARDKKDKPFPHPSLLPSSSNTNTTTTNKQIRAVQEMADALGLYNVETRHARIEDVNGRFDYVVGRSVTAIPRFLGWARPKLRIPKQQQQKKKTAAGEGEEEEHEDDEGGRPPAPGVLYITGRNPVPKEGEEEEEEEMEEAPEPERIYDITELLSAYEGDKVVMHFNAWDLLSSLSTVSGRGGGEEEEWRGEQGQRYGRGEGGRRGAREEEWQLRREVQVKEQYDGRGNFRPRNEGIDRVGR